MKTSAEWSWQRNRYEKKEIAIEQAMLDHVEAYKAIYKKAEDEDRDPDQDEQKDITDHLKAINVLDEEKRASRRTSRRSRAWTTRPASWARRPRFP